MFCKADMKIIVGKYQPEGLWDKQGRWYPSDTEKAPCCSSIRRPTTAYPKSLWIHCQSPKHIENRINVLPEINTIKYKKWVLWFRIVELIQDKHIDRKDMEALIEKMLVHYDFEKGITDKFKEVLFIHVVDYLI